MTTIATFQTVEVREAVTDAQGFTWHTIHSIETGERIGRPYAAWKNPEQAKKHAREYEAGVRRPWTGEGR